MQLGHPQPKLANRSRTLLLFTVTSAATDSTLGVDGNAG